MSSPVRRIQIRLFKKRGVEKVPCPSGRTEIVPGVFDAKGLPVTVPVMVWPQFAPKTEIAA